MWINFSLRIILAPSNVSFPCFKGTFFLSFFLSPYTYLYNQDNGKLTVEGQTVFKLCLALTLTTLQIRHVYSNNGDPMAFYCPILCGPLGNPCKQL